MQVNIYIQQMIRHISGGIWTRVDHRSLILDANLYQLVAVWRVGAQGDPCTATIFLSLVSPSALFCL
jgi:hypothetical protein